MPMYNVMWEMPIDEAESPIDAAIAALAIQRDPQSIATFFTVQDMTTQKITYVDLEEEEVNAQK